MSQIRQHHQHCKKITKLREPQGPTPHFNSVLQIFSFLDNRGYLIGKKRRGTYQCPGEEGLSHCSPSCPSPHWLKGACLHPSFFSISLLGRWPADHQQVSGSSEGGTNRLCSRTRCSLSLLLANWWRRNPTCQICRRGREMGYITLIDRSESSFPMGRGTVDQTRAQNRLWPA